MMDSECTTPQNSCTQGEMTVCEKELTQRCLSSDSRHGGENLLTTFWAIHFANGLIMSLFCAFDVQVPEQFPHLSRKCMRYCILIEM